MSLLVFEGHERRRRVTFRAACGAIRRGETPDEVSRALRAAGGKPYPDAGTRRRRIWHIDGALPGHGHMAMCTVDFDEHGVVLEAQQRGDRPR
jgi:hypothetical protein